MSAVSSGQSKQIAEIFRQRALTGGAIPVEEDIGQYGRIRLSELRQRHHRQQQSRERPSQAIKALVFDIYGTLFMSSSGDISLADDSRNWQHSVQSLLDRYNISAEPEELRSSLRQAIVAEHKRKRERGIEHPEVEIRAIWRSLEDLSPVQNDDIPLFAAEYEAIVNPVAPMPGLRALLVALRGFPLGIISNAQFYTELLFPAFLEKPLAELGFDPSLLVYSFQEGCAKPSVRLYEIMTERLHAARISPKNVLYIGNDMLNDVWAAAQAGFQTAIFAGDRRSFRPRTSDPRCNGLKADYIIDTLNDVYALFNI